MRRLMVQWHNCRVCVDGAAVGIVLVAFELASAAEQAVAFWNLYLNAAGDLKLTLSAMER